MDINSIIFIVGFVLLLFILKIYPVIFQSKQARYSRFFRKLNNVRFSVIQEISNKHQSSLPDDLSLEEMIGVLSFICAKESVSYAYSSALRFADMGWDSKFNEDFFTKLFTIAKRFQNGFWLLESTELMNLGKMLAKKYEFPEWVHAFHVEVENMRQRRLTNTNLRRQL